MKYFIWFGLALSPIYKEHGYNRYWIPGQKRLKGPNETTMAMLLDSMMKFGKDFVENLEGCWMSVLPNDQPLGHRNRRQKSAVSETWGMVVVVVVVFLPVRCTWRWVLRWSATSPCAIRCGRVIGARAGAVASLSSSSDCSPSSTTSRGSSRSTTASTSISSKIPPGPLYDSQTFRLFVLCCALTDHV